MNRNNAAVLAAILLLFVVSVRFDLWNAVPSWVVWVGIVYLLISRGRSGQSDHGCEPADAA